MIHNTLVSVHQLQALMREGAALRVVDCSFDLMKPAVGLEQFTATHIAGASHAQLDQDLSAEHGHPARASGGRHPLPTREDFARRLDQMGLANHQQVVVYDRNGNNFCGRLWWMLQWLGHEAVAVLDGGLQAWHAAGGATESGPAAVHPASHFELHAPRVSLVHTASVAAGLDQAHAPTLIDARAAPRYRGEVEPLDPIAGHIPGALNRPFIENFDPQGLFKPPALLRREFEALLAGRDAARVVHHCGSGVSAVPNLLAMQIAGLGTAALYAGSWSEWSNTPGLPTRTGAQP